MRGDEVVRALESFGFEVTRQRGSHVRLRHPDGRRTTVPLHAAEQLSVGLVRTILREVEIDRDEFVKRLRQL